MDSLAWSRTFPVLAISRLYLRDELGFSTEQVQRLTNEDMVRIADYVELFYRDVSPMERHVRFITTLVLSQVQPTAEEIQRCDACDTWVATHEVLVGQALYYVCDKPKCQDAIATLKGKLDAE